MRLLTLFNAPWKRELAWSILGMLILLLLSLTHAHASPCFDSLASARAVYPVQHIAWQGRKGHEEYFKGYKGQHVKCDTKEARKEVMPPATRSARSLERQVHDSRPRPAPSLAGAATPETTGSAAIHATPVRWIAQSIEVFEEQPPRAASFPAVPLPAVFVPPSKPFAVAVMPTRASPMTWWTVLVHLFAAALFLFVLYGLTWLIGEPIYRTASAWRGWR